MSGRWSSRVDQLRVKNDKGVRNHQHVEVGDLSRILNKKNIPYLFLTSHLDHFLFFLMHTIIIVDSCCCFCFCFMLFYW